MLIHVNDLTQNAKIPTVGNHATVQVAFHDGDIIATAATFVPQRDICKNIHAGKDDGLLLLDDENEDTEEYDWQNEPPVEDFGNLDID